MRKNIFKRNKLKEKILNPFQYYFQNFKFLLKSDLIVVLRMKDHLLMDINYFHCNQKFEYFLTEKNYS